MRIKITLMSQSSDMICSTLILFKRILFGSKYAGFKPLSAIVELSVKILYCQ